MICFSITRITLTMCWVQMADAGDSNAQNIPFGSGTVWVYSFQEQPVLWDTDRSRE